ncbi:phosphonate ABC transporter substrate-binding protein [Tistrella bauzanensis]|uniref:Phosphonate ABC transporter substrate-binding protein n=1 Tax=Tistrella bauzanensis TaxID=657419 RepID=A0ABQ1I8J9_9PROT|nr:phosphonate ABC transporter substrate-binding protein [Tistrella bauzanensis]GGB24603.1 phosphonate ABC transporter substrate-binding protein [Tistrella bauzanensis]
MFLKRLSLAAAAAAVAIGTALPAVAADDLKISSMDQINFGIISTESSQNLRTMWDPFLADMSAKLGVEVKAFFAPDYAGIIQGMRFDKVDVAWFGNKSAMEAVDRAGGEIFAQTVAADGSPGYWSLLITQADRTDLNNLDDFLAKAKDLTFANGDPNSTSGFLVPSYYVFAQNNVDARTAFKRTLSANHETNALAVANGQVDVATNNTENLARLEKTFPEKAKQIKAIWKSPLIPADPIVWRTNLPEDAKTKIKSFFMTYGVEGPEVEKEKAVLAGLTWAPFRDSSNDQLVPIRQLELFRTKAKLTADEGMAADEKAKKIAEIDAQLDVLNKRAAEIEKAAKAS